LSEGIFACKKYLTPEASQRLKQIQTLNGTRKGKRQTTNEDVQVGTTNTVIGYEQLAQYQVQGISSYSCTTCDMYVTLAEYLALGYTMPAGYRAYNPAGDGTKWIPA